MNKFDNKNNQEIVKASEQVITEPVKVRPVPKPEILRTGVVTKCDMLRVRQAAEQTARVITEIPKGTKVNILGRVKEFYRVDVNGIAGYCMKMFID